MFDLGPSGAEPARRVADVPDFYAAAKGATFGYDVFAERKGAGVKYLAPICEACLAGACLPGAPACLAPALLAPACLAPLPAWRPCLPGAPAGWLAPRRCLHWRRLAGARACCAAQAAQASSQPNPSPPAAASAESRKLQLLAVTSDGRRVYFSVLPRGYGRLVEPLADPARQRPQVLQALITRVAVPPSTQAAGAVNPVDMSRWVCAGRGVAVVLAGWLAGWQAGWLAGRLAGWLAGWLAGRLAGWQAGAGSR